MVKVSAEFDEEAHNILVSVVFTSLLQYMSIVTLTIDIQKIWFILSPWFMCLPSLMKKTNSLVSIVFTSLYPYMSIVTLTFDLQNQ